MFCIVYVMVLFVSWVSPGVILEGPCPEIKTVDAFNLTAFCSGQWFQLARYPNDFEKQGECVSLNPTIEDGVFKFNATEVLDGKLHLVNGFITVDPVRKGEIYLNSESVTAENTGNKFPLQILEVDYDNFYFPYECRYDEKTNMRHEYAWIWARSRELQGKPKQEFEDLLKSHSYIDVKKMEWERYGDDDCKFDGSY